MLIEGTKTPSISDSFFKVTFFSFFSFNTLSTFLNEFSPSPISMKSNISLYGAGFVVITGPPANISGQFSFRSFDLKGILFLSRISNTPKKSKSNDIEKAIESVSLYGDAGLSVFIILALMPENVSAIWNSFKYPSEESANSSFAGYAIIKL